MSGAVIPDVGEVAVLNSILSTSGAVAQPLTLKLYSNNKTPARDDDSSDYTEVAGGGYVNVDLTNTDFVVTSGSPSQALYNAFVDFTFTGATNSPGTIYGYFVVDNNDVLIIAERFDDDIVPFTPVNGSLIRIKPKLTAASVNSD